jgi:WD40 repeat protein
MTIRPTGQMMKFFNKQTGSPCYRICDIIYSPSNKQLAYYYYCHIMVLDITSGELICCLSVPNKKYITCICYSPNSKYIISGDTDGQIIQFDLSTKCDTFTIIKVSHSIQYIQATHLTNYQALMQLNKHSHIETIENKNSNIV